MGSTASPPTADRASGARRAGCRPGSRWRPSADDGRPGVLVEAAGRANLDVLEAGGGQLALELIPSQGAGDAPGPVVHIESRVLIHVGIGDDVGDREAATGPKHPSGLAENRRLIGGQAD